MRQKSLMGYFSRVALLLITAAKVTSLPVPAVVGTAINVGIFLITFKTPFIFPMGLFGRATRAPTIFAQSMGDPPPKAIIALQLLS